MDEREKQLILSRINHLKTEVEEGKNLILQNPYNGKVWEGRVAAIEGLDGELTFLDKLLKGDY